MPVISLLLQLKRTRFHRDIFTLFKMDSCASKPVSRHVETNLRKTCSTRVVSHQQRTTLRMIVFAFWIGFFGWLANFDAAFGGIVLLMDSYKKSFGSCTVDKTVEGRSVETCTLTALQQSLIQVTLLFMAVGGFTSGLAGGYIGRRGTVQIGCVLIAAGAGGMMGSTGSFLNYMVCKCIGGVGIGMLYTAAPIWGSESVAPQKRGLLMSLYNVGLASGNVVAAAVSVSLTKSLSFLALISSATGLCRLVKVKYELGMANAYCLPDPGGCNTRFRQFPVSRIPSMAVKQGSSGESTIIIC